MVSADTFLTPSVTPGSVILGVAVFVLYVAMIWWVAADASRRRESGLAWGLIAFVLGPVGWLIYVARRRPSVV